MEPLRSEMEHWLDELSCSVTASASTTSSAPRSTFSAEAERTDNKNGSATSNATPTLDVIESLPRPSSDALASLAHADRICEAAERDAERWDEAENAIWTKVGD